MRKTMILSAAFLMCSLASGARSGAPESVVFAFSRMDADPVTASIGGTGILSDYVGHIGASYRLCQSSDAIDVNGAFELGEGFLVKVEYLSNSGKEMDILTDPGKVSGKYKPVESLFSAGAAIRLSESFSIEAGFNNCKSAPYEQVELKGTTFDAHIRFESRSFSMALGASSLGSGVEYKGSTFEVPTSFDLAAAYRLHFGEKAALCAQTEINWYTCCGLGLAAGASLDLGSLRLGGGYSLGGVVPSGLSAGLSYAFGKIRIAACWNSSSVLTFGARFNF